MLVTCVSTIPPVMCREIKEAFWIPPETEDEEPRTLWVQVQSRGCWGVRGNRATLVCSRSFAMRSLNRIDGLAGKKRRSVGLAPIVKHMYKVAEMFGSTDYLEENDALFAAEAKNGDRQDVGGIYHFPG